MLTTQLPVSRRSALLFHWRAAACDLNAITGHAGTLAAAGAISVTDAQGVAISTVNSQPPWTWAGGQPSLRLLNATPACTFSFPWAVKPSALTVYVKLIAQDATVTTYPFLIGDGAAGPCFQLQMSSTAFTLDHWYTSGAHVTSTLSLAHSNGQTVETRSVLNANGSCQVGVSLNSGAESTSTTSGTATFAAAWSLGKLWINSYGNSFYGKNDIVVVKIASGAQSLATMQAAF